MGKLLAGVAAHHHFERTNANVKHATGRISIGYLRLLSVPQHLIVK